MDYTTATAKLGNRGSRKVANNTYLRRRDGGVIALQLHETDVITFAPKSATLNSGGWRTVTTKARINDYAPYGWRISQERGVWTLHRDGVAIGYADGVTLFASGKVHGAVKVSASAAEIRLRAKVRKYAREFVAALEAGKVEAPGLGDCMLCGLRTADGGIPVGEASHDRSHITEHMREGYFVPSLIVRACETFDKAPAVMQQLYSMFTGSTVPRFMSGEWITRRLQKALTRYLYRQLGMVA